MIICKTLNKLGVSYIDDEVFRGGNKTPRATRFSLVRTFE